MNHRQIPTLDWEDVRYFLAIARHGTLLGAARNLRVATEIVVRRLDSLETSLGDELFTRNASTFALNAAGAAALAEAAQMEMAACSLTQKRAWYR